MAAKGIETIIEIIGAAAGASGSTGPLTAQNSDNAFYKWKMNNFHGDSCSSSSSEGLRRRNVSNSVDKMKRIMNDDLAARPNSVSHQSERPRPCRQ